MLERLRQRRREMLGALLGELLRELAPEGLYETVEAARIAARHRRKGNVEAGAELASLLQELPFERSHEVVLAFSADFGVVKTAEQVHRMRRRIDYHRARETEPPSPRASFAELHRRCSSLEERR